MKILINQYLQSMARLGNSECVIASVMERGEALSIHDRLCLMDDKGQALVEMALLLPLLLMLMTGIFSIGFAYSNQQALTQATGLAAQYLASARGVSTDPCAEVRSTIHNAAPQLDLTKLNVTLTMNGATVSTTSCSDAADDLTITSGTYGSITVYATYPCNIGVLGVNFSSSCLLQAPVTELEY